MNNLKLALRNLIRNRRRSLTTIFAMVIGMIALLLFGGFISSIYFGLQTGIVRTQGHLHIYKEGHLEFGSSRPTDYFIDDYKTVISTINNDEYLKQNIQVITPVVSLAGIAGNYSADSSSTFIGSGVIPSDKNKMGLWDQHNLGLKQSSLSLSDDNISQGIVGLGMAKMLNLCESLEIEDCKGRPIAIVEGDVDEQVLSLQSLLEDENLTEEKNTKKGIQIDLLASTGSGAPNVVSLAIIEAQKMPNKVLDDSFITMHLEQAQKLVFDNKARVSSIFIQLKRTEMIEKTQVYLRKLLSQSALNQNFEVKNYTEFNSEFFQVVSMFIVIFIFIALMISLVVLFTTVNTLTMSVMERIPEIGSLRAMGLRRSAIRWQFLLEGAVIGIAGATLGVIVSIIFTQIFNLSGFSWSPPGSVESRDLKILLFANPLLLIGTWLLMATVATVSSLLPARYASRMNIVNAIRHH